MLMDLCKGSDSSDIPVLIGTTRETEDVPRRAEAEAKLPGPTDCLVPITHEAVKENGDFPLYLQSPFTVVRKQLKQACIASESDVTGTTSNIASVDNYNDDDDDNDNDSPRTPKDGVFYPFAPGPDTWHKPPRVSQIRTCLNRYTRIFCKLLCPSRLRGALTEMSNVEYGSDDCKTPLSPLHFSEIFDTCPAAPVKVKLAGKPRNIQVGLCKKLEF